MARAIVLLPALDVPFSKTMRPVLIGK